MDQRLTRRQAMAISAAAGAYVLLGCGDDDSSSPTGSAPKSSSARTRPADCILSPEQTEGPYYVDNDLVRSDITEGREGVPLDVRLTVQDATSCEAIEDATVEVWHCDALGEYSGVHGSEGNF